MNDTDLETFNAYASIIEEVDIMLKALDRYRKHKREKNETEATKALFKVHSIESVIRKKINQEHSRQNPELYHPKSKAA
jgi:hypothetical protein